MVALCLWLPACSSGDDDDSHTDAGGAGFSDAGSGDSGTQIDAGGTHGGSGGMQGDAGTRDAASSAQDDAGSDADSGAANTSGDCVDRTVIWGPNGGLVAYQDEYTLAPCRTFSLKRMPARTPDGEASCQNQVAADATVSVDDVNAVLASPDMKAAIAAAPILYGGDPRPVDGTVFRIRIGDATIDVGTNCSGASGCIAIPAGVTAARDTLQALTTQQRALGDCKRVP
jgi:hypothetical protein